MNEPVVRSEQEEAALTEEVKQLLRDELERAMDHEFDGSLGSPEAIKRLSTQVVRVEMTKFIVRLQAKGLDRMARDS